MRFKNASVWKNAFKHSYIQWNVGTACVSECGLKMLASRGLRVGPSKSLPVTPLPFPFDNVAQEIPELLPPLPRLALCCRCLSHALFDKQPLGQR